MSALFFNYLRNSQVSPDPGAPRGITFVDAVQEIIRHVRARRQERRSAAALDGRDRHDLGLSRWDVEREIARPIWRG
jgi:uncharacterized protein YjiS (DUF1127 family)